MSRKKKEVGAENGTHLTIHRYDDGTVDMQWNWDALLAEVRAVTGSDKQDIVAVTEEKVKKSRTRKVLDTVTEIASTTKKKIRDVIKEVVHHEKVTPAKPAKKPRKKKGE